MRCWLLFGLLGCYGPTPQAGSPCTERGECPRPLACIADRCVDSTTLPDADLTCTCTSPSQLTCAGGERTCALGCETADNVSRCLDIAPSNGATIDAALAATESITLTEGTTTLDTDTGAITGAFERPAGTGELAGIHYQPLGDTLAVFSMHAFTITSRARVHFTGSRAAIFVVATHLLVDGTIDGSAGCYDTDRACPGPGGGRGGTTNINGSGCGPGNNGTPDGVNDTGGSGGGASTAGGDGGASDSQAGPLGGVACQSESLEPLVGGSGGGYGSYGMATSPTYGGGGGGALQLTALDTITINGTIVTSGAGGEGGLYENGSTGAGNGGGGGGAILLEAPTITLATSSILAANGGAGGGAAGSATNGGDGANGSPNTSPATGGVGQGTTGGAGGNGGAASAPPAAGMMRANGGGGGGAAGTIYLRTRTPTLSGTISPQAGTGDLRTR